MKYKNIFVVALLLISYAANSQDFNKIKFIEDANFIATKYLNDYLGKQLVYTSVRLNQKLIGVETGGEMSNASNFLKNIKPERGFLQYDLFFKGDSVTSFSFVFDSTLHLDYNWTDVSVMDLIGWRNVLNGTFKFNIDKLKEFIAKDTSIRNADYYLTLRSASRPKSIVEGQLIYVETFFYWDITTNLHVRENGENYDRVYRQREIKIDANTGEVFSDELFTTQAVRYR